MSNVRVLHIHPYTLRRGPHVWTESYKWNLCKYEKIRIFNFHVYRYIFNFQILTWIRPTCMKKTYIRDPMYEKSPINETSVNMKIALINRITCIKKTYIKDQRLILKMIWIHSNTSLFILKTSWIYTRKQNYVYKFMRSLI